MKSPEARARHAANERERRKNYTPEQQEAERARGRRRYEEGKKDPAWYGRHLAKTNRSAERRRRRLGIPSRARTPEQLRQKRRAKEARYWRRSAFRRISMRLRNRLRQFLSGECKSSFAQDLVGATRETLRLWLSMQFKPGMTWENHGPTGWHVEHIKPCALFDLVDLEEQKRCFHFSNLQPLWAVENYEKGTKMLTESVS